MRDFRGKIAVVTGAASGIGKAMALALAREGAVVHLLDRDAERGEAARAEVAGRSPRATLHVVDCTDAGAMLRVADAVFAADQRVDLLFNNAGIGHSATIESLTLQQWNRVLAVNLFGVVHGLQAFLPRMLEQGGPAHIVNTASCLGLFAVPTMAPYCASKFAIVGLSESLALELAPRGIGVTALCPGIIDTDIIRTADMAGDSARRQGAVLRFYRERGSSPARVAEDALLAIRQGRVVQVSPSSQVLPAWLLKRLSGALYQRLVGAGFARFFGGH